MVHIVIGGWMLFTRTFFHLEVNNIGLPLPHWRCGKLDQLLLLCTSSSSVCIPYSLYRLYRLFESTTQENNTIIYELFLLGSPGHRSRDLLAVTSPPCLTPAKPDVESRVAYWTVVVTLCAFRNSCTPAHGLFPVYLQTSFRDDFGSLWFLISPCFLVLTNECTSTVIVLPGLICVYFPPSIHPKLWVGLTKERTRTVQRTTAHECRKRGCI